jgi:hypothetical protein
MSKPRKSRHYPAEIDTLIRAAQPTYAEIEGEPDPDKRRERERERDIATDELIRISQSRKLFNQLSRTRQFEVRWFIEGLKRARGEFPTRKGGRPPDEHRRLLLAVKMAELVEGGATATQAIQAGFKWSNAEFGSPATIGAVNDIFYENDPEWQRLVRVELARRAYETAVDEDARRATMRARRRTPTGRQKRKAIAI